MKMEESTNIGIHHEVSQIRKYLKRFQCRPHGLHSVHAMSTTDGCHGDHQAEGNMKPGTDSVQTYPLDRRIGKVCSGG